MPFYAYVVRSKKSGTVVYCGITTKALRYRWSQHKRSEYALGRAIRKHGSDAFSMELIAESWSFEDLKVLEQQLIEQYRTFGRSGYNLTLGGDGVLGVKFSDATRAKFSRDRTGKRWSEEQKARLRAVREAMPHPMLGKRHSVDTIEKIKESRPDTAGERNHFFGKRHAPETIVKISASARARRLTPEQREGLRGENSPRFGRKHTDEAKERIASAQRGPKNHNFGKPWSAERRAKHMATLAAKGLKVEVKNAIL